MKQEQWMILVNQSGKGLYKRGYLGREVYEFEIKAALKAQSIFAQLTEADKIRITRLDFTTPPEGSTYRSMTEPIHRTIKSVPNITESSWVNVWHSVAEASYLYHREYNRPDIPCTGMTAYLAYCRECRDWEPYPKTFSELPPIYRPAWSEVEYQASVMMRRGFKELGLEE